MLTDFAYYSQNYAEVNAHGIRNNQKLSGFLYSLNMHCMINCYYILSNFTKDQMMSVKLSLSMQLIQILPQY